MPTSAVTSPMFETWPRVSAMFKRPVKYGCSGSNGIACVSTLRAAMTGASCTLPSTFKLPFWLIRLFSASVPFLPGSVVRFSAVRLKPSIVCTATGAVDRSSTRSATSSTLILLTVASHGRSSDSCSRVLRTVLRTGELSHSITPSLLRTIRARVSRLPTSAIAIRCPGRSTLTPLATMLPMRRRSPRSTRYAASLISIGLLSVPSMRPTATLMSSTSPTVGRAVDSSCQCIRPLLTRISSTLHSGVLAGGAALSSLAAPPALPAS